MKENERKRRKKREMRVEKERSGSGMKWNSFTGATLTSLPSSQPVLLALSSFSPLPSLSLSSLSPSFFLFALHPLALLLPGQESLSRKNWPSLPSCFLFFLSPSFFTLLSIHPCLLTRSAERGGGGCSSWGWLEWEDEREEKDCFSFSFLPLNQSFERKRRSDTRPEEENLFSFFQLLLAFSCCLLLLEPTFQSPEKISFHKSHSVSRSWTKVAHLPFLLLVLSSSSLLSSQR